MSKKKVAFITGITGQDGSYLAELLLSKNYKVYGLVRRVASEDADERFSRINHILDKVELHEGDITDYPTIWRAVAKIKPDECYHLAAQSFITTSFKDDFSTLNININGTHYLLSALKELKPDCKFYFAGTSELFGKVIESPQSELTEFNPVSYYGISKNAGFQLTKIYRDAYGMYSCNGILFNHESPRRGFEFVTRKITSTAAKIKLGLANELRLGNLEATRDWGYAGDYVEAMWRMLQQKEPKDYVIATGETHSVKEFAECAFGYLGLDWKKYVKADKIFLRPVEVDTLCGDASRARKELGWTPRVLFEELVHMMVDSDLERQGHKKERTR